MSSQCRSIQDRLAQHGPTALQSDTPAQEHLVECEGCYAFLEALPDSAKLINEATRSWQKAMRSR